MMEETLKNENVTTFPPRESLVSDIPAGDGNIANLFLYSVSGGMHVSRHVFTNNFSWEAEKKVEIWST
jgi:hypothetical protein